MPSAEKDSTTVACGATIEEAQPGFSRIALSVGDNHRNGLGSVMGGVPFTMGDFAFAVAANVGNPPTVSTNCSIDFLGTAKTDKLVAECRKTDEASASLALT